MTKKLDLKAYSWILRGTQRIKILKILNDIKTPSEISKETKLKFSNISDNLKLMQQKKIVICLNPKEKSGRLYNLTAKGKKIRKKIVKKQ